MFRFAAAAALALTACAVRQDRAAVAAAGPAYKPHARDVTITTVPLLVKELAHAYPFLAKDFSDSGVLAGKEVYAFSPSTITAEVGDTLRLHIINPEDDLHNFAMQTLAVVLPPQSVVDVMYIARAPGIYEFSCTVPAHMPMMHGELVVLAPGALTMPTGPNPPPAVR